MNCELVINIQLTANITCKYYFLFFFNTAKYFLQDYYIAYE